MMVVGVGIARPPPSPSPPQLKLQIRYFHLRSSQLCCALSKQGDRFIGSLINSDNDNSDHLHRLIKKFVTSSSKHVALNALSHLLSATTAAEHPRLSSFALPLYLVITEASWFDWNPKLVADVVALLYKLQRFDEAGTLIAETLSRKLRPRKRVLCSFYCHLIDSQSKHNLRDGVLESLPQLKQLLLSGSSPLYLKQRGYQSMIKAMCEIGLPSEAEELMNEMSGMGIKLSVFEFRCLVYSYGKLGLFGEMKKMLAQMEGEGFPPDTVTSNMVLSSFGAHKQLAEMASWLQKRKDLGVPISIRTYNSVLNSCPKLNLLLHNMENMPLSLEELVEDLSVDERSLVLQLVASSSSVMEDAMTEKASELKLDLHGMHLSSAYLIMLVWFDELRSQCQKTGNDFELPAEITVVCGSGKHSVVRGKSPVKDMVKKMIVQTNCPLRNDSKNNGCFIAKGNVLKEWIAAI